MEKSLYVYILASKRNGTLYIGVTSDLPGRIYQHKQGLGPGFTKKYGVRMLVHFEQFDDAVAAIQREKNLKQWIRRWKLELIEKHNPAWRDLYEDIAAG